MSIVSGSLSGVFFSKPKRKSDCCGGSSRINHRGTETRRLPRLYTYGMQQSKVKEAEEFGIDISLLRENLSLTPTERVEKLQRLNKFYQALLKAKRRGSGKNHKSARRS